MTITLTRNSDVPLRQQLAEQIVFLITTGQLRTGDELPSVRALARRVKVHHNTVSAAYKELVRRDWVSRRPGSRLVVGKRTQKESALKPGLDELINETIRKSKEMGYTLQALRERVRERLMAQPPDHILVVEEEMGLSAIIQKEIQENTGLPVEVCSPERFFQEPGLGIGALVLAPNHNIGQIESNTPRDRPLISVAYSRAEQYINVILKLEFPSVVAVASISESLLKTARGLLAPAITRKHTFKEFLISGKKRLDLKAVDLTFCDSIAMDLISCREKIRYQLIDSDCLDQIRIAIDVDAIPNAAAPRTATRRTTRAR
jgi:DNA-binding transcriptional regulator YhcF (GntR family)